MNFQNAAIKFFQTTDGRALWSKYASKTLVGEVAGAMANSLPTITAASIAFDRLVKNGDISRTDGRDEEDDRAEAHADAKKGLDAAIAAASQPLTSSEIEYFASLSQFELSKLYWGPDNDGITGFGVRYRLAMEQHGFREPAHYAGGLR